MRRLVYGLAVGAVLGAGLVSALLPRRAQAQDELLRPLPPEPGENKELSVRVTPEMTRYSNIRYALYFGGVAFSAFALLLLLRSRVSARIRDLAEAKGKNGLLRAYIYYPLFTLVYGALALPLTFYASFLLPRQYGLSNHTLGGWMLDGIKGFAISSVLGPPVVALLYWTIRRSPRRWWLGFWVACIPLLVISILLGPLLIDPLFNRFQPLRDERLRSEILALAARAGIERSRVFEVDASKRTKGINAYVTGIGGSARIVLWDTLLQRMEEDEILFVMAHEMGHYVEKHVPLALGASIFGTLFFFLFADCSARKILQVNGEQWGVRGMDDLASFPLFLLILNLLGFFGSPVESGISRHFESRADAFGLRLTGDGKAAASAFVKLSELNLSSPNPPPFVEFWTFSHPPLQKRIDRALGWGLREGE